MPNHVCKPPPTTTTASASGGQEGRGGADGTQPITCWAFREGSAGSRSRRMCRDMSFMSSFVPDKRIGGDEEPTPELAAHASK